MSKLNQNLFDTLIIIAVTVGFALVMVKACPAQRRVTIYQPQTVLEPQVVMRPRTVYEPKMFDVIDEYHWRRTGIFGFGKLNYWRPQHVQIWRPVPNQTQPSTPQAPSTPTWVSPHQGIHQPSSGATSGGSRSISAPLPKPATVPAWRPSNR